MNRGITYRPTTQAERNYALREFGLSYSPDESAVIIVDDKIVAFSDEYGTVRNVSGRDLPTERIEKFVELASTIWGECM